MITMAVIALVGLGVIALATLLIQHRAAVHRRIASALLAEDVQDKLQRAKALDVRLAQAVLGGADMDTAIDDFTKDRTIIHALPTEKGWLWDSEDLAKWNKAQFAVRVAAIQHKARLVSLSILVCVVLVVVAVDAVIYSNLAASPPVLSPHPPAKSAVVPPPLSPSSSQPSPANATTSITP